MLRAARKLIEDERGAMDVNFGLYGAMAMALVFSIVHMLMGN